MCQDGCYEHLYVFPWGSLQAYPAKDIRGVGACSFGNRLAQELAIMHNKTLVALFSTTFASNKYSRSSPFYRNCLIVSIQLSCRHDREKGLCMQKKISSRIVTYKKRFECCYFHLH